MQEYTTERPSELNTKTRKKRLKKGGRNRIGRRGPWIQNLLKFGMLQTQTAVATATGNPVQEAGGWRMENV